jgi:hypothetical protein
MMILVRIVVTLTSTPETILSKLSCQNLIQFSGKKLRLRRTATHKKKNQIKLRINNSDDFECEKKKT